MKKELLKHINLIRKMAWVFVRTHPGLEYDDIFEEGCLICLEKMHKYDPERGAVSTFLYYVIQSHFSSLLSKNKHKHEYLEEHISTITTLSPEEMIIKQDTLKHFFMALSPEALEMAKIAMKIGEYENTPKKVRGEAVKKLRQKGWAWSRIWQTNNELKLAVKQL